jgi:hypothetical protein
VVIFPQGLQKAYFEESEVLFPNCLLGFGNEQKIEAKLDMLS